LAQQVAHEPLVPWTDFPATVHPDKMVRVITDGGANTNPGLAGWSAVIRQNGITDHATNNAMEICAVVEVLRALPEGMHVCVSTDSAYVKNGITEWFPGWIRNYWRNSKGAAVANKSLWQALMNAVSRMRKNK
jgi:ribonuclease HI